MLVASVGDHTPVRVPGGLIHHWIGAAFIPNVRVEDVLAVTRDYARYKEFYKPGVEDAKPIRSSDGEDEFTILFANNSILSKTLLEGDYVCDYIRVNDKRWYSESQTTEMHEIKDFGRPDEANIPPNRGSGYIWRMFGTTRLEERDGGVFVELEAIALRPGHSGITSLVCRSYHPARLARVTPEITFRNCRSRT